MIIIEKVLPKDTNLKAIGIEIDGEIYIGITGGAEVDSEFINKVEGDLENG